MIFFSCVQYKATDLVCPKPGKVEVVYTPEGGKPEHVEVFTFKNSGGVTMAMYNTDEVSNTSVIY